MYYVCVFMEISKLKELYHTQLWYTTHGLAQRLCLTIEKDLQEMFENI